MNDDTDLPSIIGRDLKLMENVAKIAHASLRTRYQYTDLKQTRRGWTFTVEVTDPDGNNDGHVARVTVELMGRPKMQQVSIDGFHYVAAAGEYTGHALRLLAHPPISDDFDIFLVIDEQEILVKDQHTVHVDYDCRFVTKDRQRT